MVTDQELLECNRRGLIPGPDEEPRTFALRVHRAIASSTFPDEVKKNVKALMDFEPDWIRVEYSNKNLPFWQGAVTWIENHVPSVQLRTEFLKGKYCKIYEREEVLAHEAVHAARAAFPDSPFEELIAYHTSKNSWRKWGGGFFQASWESYLFMLSLVIPFLCIPLLCFGLLRLWRLQSVLERCKRNLAPLLSHPHQALAVLVRLTGKEIKMFAHSPETIQIYISAQTCLRWRLLKMVYFSREASAV